MSVKIPESVEKRFKDMLELVKSDFEQIKKEIEKDLEIEEFDLDKSLLDIPKLQTKWSSRLADEALVLRDLYNTRRTIELERWKYYNGKQTDKYLSEYGVVHEKILKSDIDKYLGCDPKMHLINSIVNVQKEKVDFIERGIKEIASRGFHIKSIIDWRRFITSS